MDRTMLSELVQQLLSRTPESRPFAPGHIFDFDDVLEAIALVEGALAAERRRADEERAAALSEAVADPNHSFIKTPIFLPAAAALWAVEITFPMILRRALFIAVCSHVEHMLRRWCNYVQCEWVLTVTPKALLKKKLPGETTAHALIRYLRDIAGIGIGNFEEWPEWRAFDLYWTVRNCLVHDGGMSDDSELLKKLESLEHVEVVDPELVLEDFPLIHLLPGACEAAVATATGLFDRIATLARADPRGAGRVL